MFRGDHPDLKRTVGRALELARDLGHPRAGSEHLLLALTGLVAGPRTGTPVAGTPTAGTPTAGALAGILARHGATPSAIGDAIHLAAPLGAGAAGDRVVLAPLGVDLDRLLGGTAALDRPALARSVLDRPARREPLLPLGAAKARRRCARLDPPLGLDAQAAYEASLRLALARRERDHRPEHLALALTALDPGVAWVLKTANADRAALLADLAASHPPPRRNPVLTADRRLGRHLRHQDLVRRYQRTTGRTPTAPSAVAGLIAG